MFLHGVTAKEFLVYIHFVGCSGMLDLVFVVDSSGSIDRARFNSVKEMIVSVVNELDVRMDRTRVGLIYYSHAAFIGFNLNDYGQVKQDVVEAIRRVPFIGNLTNTAAALRLVYGTAFQRRVGDRAGVPNVAVVVSDSNPNVEAQLTSLEAAMCRSHGIRMVVAIVYSENLDVSELMTIASRPLSQNVVRGSSNSALDDMISLLVDATCDGISFLPHTVRFSYNAFAPGALSDDARLTADVCLSVAYIGPKSRTERPIGRLELVQR